MRQAKRRKYHYIYKTTCKVTGKYYIGMHSTDNLDDGYIGSGKILGYSIRKHGKENHICEIIEHYFSREWLREREAELVCAEKLTDPMCMNLKLGGEGGWEIVNSHPMKSERSRISIKKSHKTTKEQFANDAAFREYYSQLQSKKMKENHAAGLIKYDTFTGKTHTEETRKRMQAAKIGYGVGSTNSQYGSCWITKDGKSIKIQKEQLDTHLTQGWVKGRKVK